MSGYFDTETQRRLQAQVAASVDFIKATPASCQAGRTMGCDDPERLAWEWIEGLLDRDSVCGICLIPAVKVEKLRSRLAEWNFRFDTCDVFLADQATAVAASESIIARKASDPGGRAASRRRC